MRIHSLVIQNMTSLKGKHHIDFDDILLEDKIFAITGDTGAGKSTLLNSISLALYGQNYKSSINQTDYVTLGESEAKVEVTLSVNGVHYIAKWSCRLKKSTGQYLKTPKTIRELYLLEGEKLTPLSYLPEKILNLSFDQFCKTIILNQGQFAKFLTSSFRERKEIIEKLYQGEVLEKLSPTIRIQLNELKQQLELKKTGIQNLNEQIDIPLEELQSHFSQSQALGNKYQLTFNIINKIEKNLHEYQNIFTQQQTNIERKLTLQKEVIEITSILNEHKKQYFLNEKSLQDAKNSFQIELPKLQHCENEYQKLKSSEEKTALLINQKTKITSQLQQQQLQVTKLKSEIESDKKKKLKLLSGTEEINSIKKEIERFRKNSDIISQKSTLSKSLETLLTDYHSQGDELNKAIAEIDQSLDKDSIERTQRELTEHSENNLKLQERIMNLRQLEKHRQMSLNKINEIQQLTLSLEESRKDLEQKLHTDQQQEKLLENSIKLHQLQEAIEMCRHESLHINHCVICFNKDLSKILDHEIESNSHGSQDSHDYQKYKKSLSEIKILIQECENKLQEIQLKLKSYTTQKEDIVKNYQDEIQNFNHIFLLQLSNTLSNSLNDFIELSESEFHQSNRNTEGLKKRLHTLETSKNERDKKVHSRDEIRNRYKKIKDEWIEIQQSIKVFTRELEVIESEIKKLIPNLTSFNETNTMELLYLELTIAQELSTISEVLKQKKESYKQLNTIIHNSEFELKDLKEQIEHNKKIEKHIQEFIEAEIGSDNPTLLINKKREFIEKLSSDFDIIKNQLKKTQLHITESESRLKSSIEQIEHSEALLQQLWHQIQSHSQGLNKDDFEDVKVFNFYRELSCAKKSEEKHLLDYLFTENHEHLCLLQDQLKAAQESTTRYATLIEQKEKVNNKVQQLEQQIDQLTIVKNHKEALYELVGKDEFRNFVLALIEKDLIYQTNHELESLCDGRYQLLHQQKTKMSPEFYILDKMKEGMSRKVSTLSGGETFMVSLAMALALAEMTRGQSEVDSFFIDEGFGTLDEDSLEDILEMLHHLHIRGKQIGIISHVKSLTKRISTNIHLKKGDQGNSSITIVYN